MAFSSNGRLPPGNVYQDRNAQWKREMSEIEARFDRQDQHARAVLEDAKRAIEMDFKQSWDGIFPALPPDTSLAVRQNIEESLRQNRTLRLHEQEKEYSLGEAERNKLRDESKKRHLEKYSALFTAAPLNQLPFQSQAQPMDVAPVMRGFSAPVPQVTEQETPAVSRTPLPTYDAPSHAQNAQARRPLPQQKSARPSWIPPRKSKPETQPGPMPSLQPTPSHPNPQFGTARTGQAGPLPSNVAAPNASRPMAEHPQAFNNTLRSSEQQYGSVSSHYANTFNKIEIPRTPKPAKEPRMSGVALEPPPPTQSQPERREPLATLAGRAINQLNPERTSPKRKADELPGLAEAAPKRAKVYATDGTESSGAAEPSEERPARKTISFDEVYNGGHAKYRHMIVEHPPHSGDWFILKCDEHGVHFNTNPLAGAAKHLHSAQHGNLSKERAQAVELLGHLVFDCDRDLAEKNNEWVKKSFENGYVPMNQNNWSKAERLSLGLSAEPAKGPKVAAQHPAGKGPSRHASSGSAATPHNRLSGITDPIPGSLYLGWWTEENRNYPVIVLPWGSLQAAGMNGSLYDTGLLGHVPKCYTIDPATGEISGWARGYESGGKKVKEREFPIKYFDVSGSVGWMKAAELSPFDFNPPNKSEIPGFQSAVEQYARLRGFPNFEYMRTHSNQIAAQNTPAPVSSTPATVQTQYPTVPSNGPVNDREMVDAGAVLADDSDQESVSKAVSDSDVDISMTNTESRRTSFSNDTYENHRDTIGPKRPSPLAHMPAATGDAEKLTTPAVHHESSSRDTSQHLAHMATARLIASTALQTQSSEQDISPLLNGTGNAEVRQAKHPNQSYEPPSRQGSESSTDQGHRRVEKIYAHSNPNRASKSPGLQAAALPENSAANSLPSVPSPATLSGIHQGQPGLKLPPLSPLNQSGFSTQLPQAGPVLAPIQQQPLSATGSPGLRTPAPSASHSPLALPLPPPTHVLKSQGPLVIQASQIVQPTNAEQSRSGPSTPVPTLSTTNGAAPLSTMAPFAQATSQLDRWRVVRATDESQSPTVPPASTEQPRRQAAPTPLSLARLSIDSPREGNQPFSPVGTPSHSLANSRANSPGRVAQSPGFQSPGMTIKARESPAPFLGSQGEVFAVSFYPGATLSPSELEQHPGIFRLTVEGPVAKTAPDSQIQFAVDPRQVKEMVVEPTGGGGTTAVKLVMPDGRTRTFMFEKFDAGRGSELGKIHARRFCRWARGVNRAIIYQNNGSFDSAHRVRETQPSESSNAITVE
ncbi:hypothetical protein B0H67DRAFT_320615 [Lasiosphaeris hirsuta]|uniref:Uncharacterized protein n=1 Tax=Lasiosphaeris hirsuta TaxID=260670 RepID=A0AA40A1S5_9PEZI|nr:hypothetical protein B0H67DRAFT_320615 [Lasiosphaeris hirsuta]